MLDFSGHIRPFRSFYSESNPSWIERVYYILEWKSGYGGLRSLQSLLIDVLITIPSKLGFFNFWKAGVTSDC